MTFGNYVLFNLLVAILVEGFSAEGEVSEGVLVGDIRGVGWCWRDVRGVGGGWRDMGV